MRIKNALTVLAITVLLFLYLGGFLLYWSAKKYEAYSILSEKQEKLEEQKVELAKLEKDLKDKKEEFKKIERYVVNLSELKKDIIKIKERIFSQPEYSIVDFNIKNVEIDDTYMNLARVELKLKETGVPLEVAGQGLCTVFNSIYKIAFNGKCSLDKNKFIFVVKKD